MGLKFSLLGALGICSAVFLFRWVRSIRAYHSPSLTEMALGFITNFLDTLGIGSFAPTTSAFRLLRMVPDELIPGTLIVGHALPTVTEAFVFINAVQIEAKLLVSLIAASLIGGWLGAGIVSALPRRTLRLGMGLGLLIAAAFLLLGRFGMLPEGGMATGVSGPRLAIALLVNFLLGALLTLGIGNYGPSLVLFSLLGMDPRVAFPVMMGSGSFVAVVGGIRFLREGKYHLRPSLGLFFGGIPGVLIAAFVVRSLPLDLLRWLVLAVILYTAGMLLRAAAAEPDG